MLQDKPKQNERAVMAKVVAAISEAQVALLYRPRQPDGVPAKVDDDCEKAMQALCAASMSACARINEISNA